MTPRSLVPFLLSAALVCVWPAAAQQPADKPLAKEPAADEKEIDQRIADTLSAVVRVKMRAVPDARSNATLGDTREGSGIVIEPGYVLTIGYLVIEPDAIEVTTVNDRTLPATLAGYDHATGFGLLKVQGELGVKPLAIGDSAALGVREPVIVVSHGGREAATLAYVMSKRQFTGSWEYLLESAIFTAPPTMTWAGAALVNRQLRLVGVGSLLVRDTVEPGTPQPGQHVRADRSPEADPRGAEGERPHRRPAAAVARAQHRGGPGPAAGEPRVAGGARGAGRRAAGRRHRRASPASR